MDEFAQYCVDSLKQLYIEIEELEEIRPIKYSDPIGYLLDRNEKQVHIKQMITDTISHLESKTKNNDN